MLYSVNPKNSAHFFYNCNNFVQCLYVGEAVSSRTRRGRIAQKIRDQCIQNTNNGYDTHAQSMIDVIINQHFTTSIH